MTEGHIPKREWGDGPWQTEEDEARWTDLETGLLCYAARHPMTGSWCGYVGVSSAHPAHGLSYWFDLDFDPEKKPEDWADIIDKERADPAARRGAESLQVQHWRQRVANWTAAQGRYPVQAMVNQLTAHGGLTYSGPIPEASNDDLWFFGFDCAHAGDICPGIDEMMRRIPDHTPRPRGSYGFREEYRTLDYVRDECRALARQLADIEATIGRISVIPVAGRSAEEIARAITETVDQIANKGTA